MLIVIRKFWFGSFVWTIMEKVDRAKKTGIDAKLRKQFLVKDKPQLAIFCFCTGGTALGFILAACTVVLLILFFAPAVFPDFQMR